jgi:hypothetical protein
MDPMTLKKIVISTAAVFCFSLAHANTLYKAYQGQYISMNAGLSYANKMFYNYVNKSNVLGFGSNLFLGYQYSPYVAPEVLLQYEDLPPLGNAVVLGLDGKFTLPIQTRFSLFARLGGAIGYLRTCVSSSCYTSDGLVPTMGLGAGYDLGHRWTGTLECNGAYYPNSTNNGSGFIGAVTVGVTRYFY